MLEKLSKLSNKSVREIADRSRQAASSLMERLKPASLDTISFAVDGEPGSVDRYLKENRAIFFCSANDLVSTRSNLEALFPSEVSRLVSRADKICEGRFALLGYSDLRFGQDVPDFHFDPFAGKSTEKKHWSKLRLEDSEHTADKKIIWELNRHQYFVTLGQAYLVTGDEKYAETFAAHINGWFDQNPPKAGVNWLSSLELAFRSISWIWAIHLFRNSPHLTSLMFSRMLNYLHAQARHIETYLSTYFSPNTHLTGEALGLYVIGSFLTEANESRRWREKGYKILMDALDFQIRDDGVYCEQSSHYSRYTADFYAALMILKQRENLPVERKHSEKLEKLYEFLMHITQPNGETPLFGDEDGGRLHFPDDRPIDDFRPSLALGAVLFGRGDFKFVAGGATPELLWLMGGEGLEKYRAIEPAEPAKTNAAFKTGGFFAMRSSWRRDANSVMIDCGPHGFINGGHAHADVLSFVLSFDGEPVFVDSGTYLYSVNASAREKFRSTSAHNCLIVNGESSSVPGDPFSWKSEANARLLDWVVDENGAFFRGTHNGFERFGADYVREVRLKGNDEIEITDLIDSSSPNSYELNFIVDPGIGCSVDGHVIRFEKPGSPEWKMQMNSNVSGVKYDLTVEDWHVSPIYGKLVETKRIVFKFERATSLKVRNRIWRG